MNTNLSPSSQSCQYYRRPLPSTCISFSSDEGKLIFREALLAGHMETYFALASQFRTQEEPAFCGLTTLVMVLNTLEVDPKQVWKGPWRFYHENMLDCCVPMEVIEKQGITFDEFICLAVCNTLDVRHHRVDASSSEDQFRQFVIEKTRCSNDIIVVSYSRRLLDQTGEGHFSPIGGYHSARDLVLIMDVARFKYPPHWVSVSKLFEAMKQVDQETKLPRGYLLLTKSVNLPTVLFRFSAQVSVTRYDRGSQLSNTTGVMACVEAILRSLTEPCENDIMDEELIEQTTHCFVNHLNTFGYNIILLKSQIESTEELSEKHQQAAADIMQAIEALQLYTIVCQVLSSRTCLELELESDLVSRQSLSRAHYIAMLLLLWPYKKDSDNTFGGRMRTLVGIQIKSCVASGVELLRLEIEQLRRQLESVLGYVRKCCGCQNHPVLASAIGSLEWIKGHQ